MVKLVMAWMIPSMSYALNLHQTFRMNAKHIYRERLSLMDVSVDAIMDRHLDDPVFHDMLKKRDSFVTHKDVINAATRSVLFGHESMCMMPLAS
ncbi:hypothetical protein SUGI_0651770 [Cryptomeria japonica]|nr:hypothetical protein SUGI_0651770 [Cryptomeria japonica]